MIDNVKKYLVGVIIGIRFGPSFSIRDDFGSITDKILYRKDSFFNEKMFPIILTNPAEIRLQGEGTGDNLIVNSTDVILTCNLDNPDVSLDSKLSPKIKLDTLAELNKNFEKEIIQGIMKEFKFSRISRIGYIHRYIFNIAELSKKFTKKTIGDTIGGISDINLRFSKKYPTPQAMAKKGVNDYHSVIFNVIKKADENEIFISIDYQAYYDPALESVKDMKFSDFLASMERYNSDTFLQWLNKHYGD